MSGLEDLNRELEEKNLLGFWTFVRETSYEPASFFEPCMWKWKDVSSALDKAGDVLDLTQSFRRFIGFRTPSVKLGTTHTMLLGAQLVKPGEIAEAHHHTMGAIRFVIRGGGAQTTVNGNPFRWNRVISSQLPASLGMITTTAQTSQSSGSMGPTVLLSNIWESASASASKKNSKLTSARLAHPHTNSALLVPVGFPRTRSNHRLTAIAGKIRKRA